MAWLENIAREDRPNRFARFFRKILALVRFCSARREQAWAMPVHLPSSDNFYAVSAKVFRSAQPTTVRAFVEYERLGLKAVLQLRPGLNDEPLIGSTDLKLLVVPMKTADVTDEHVIAALRLIRSEPGPILVHCRHGADRTGLVVAMYRIIFEGWSREEARREMLYGGYGFHRRKRRNIVKYLEEADIGAIGKAVNGERPKADAAPFQPF